MLFWSFKANVESTRFKRRLEPKRVLWNTKFQTLLVQLDLMSMHSAFKLQTLSLKCTRVHLEADWDHTEVHMAAFTLPGELHRVYASAPDNWENWIFCWGSVGAQLLGPNENYSLFFTMYILYLFYLSLPITYFPSPQYVHLTWLTHRGKTIYPLYRQHTTVLPPPFSFHIFTHMRRCDKAAGKISL